jgi:hypothetical protein
VVGSLSDLSFSGGLLPGANPRSARLYLTAFFRLQDPDAVEPFFQGRPVTLRRKLPRPEAEALCDRLRRAGLDCRVIDRDSPPPRARAATDSAGPNPFQVRADSDHRVNPEAAQFAFLAAAIASGLLALLLLILVIDALRWSPPPPLTGPRDTAVDRAGRLYLLTADAILILDRSGRGSDSIAARDLGLASFTAPLLPQNDGVLLVGGRSGNSGAAQSWRCDRVADRCRPLLEPSPLRARALADAGPAGGVHALDGEQLLWIDAGGVRARAALPTAVPRPRLLYDDGLLVASLDNGPLLAVLRPDPAAFGVQLDAPLLLPPAPGNGDPPVIVDFARWGEGWGALLAAPGQAPALHLFDNDWGHRQRVELPSGMRATRLQSWGQRLLAIDPGSPTLARLHAGAGSAVPFLPAPFLERQQQRQASARWQSRARGLALASTAVALGAALLALLLAAERRHGRDAAAAKPELILEHERQRFSWFPVDEQARRARYRQLTALAALALCASAASALTLGPAAALLLLALTAMLAGLAAACGSPAGHIGLHGSRLLLVDHGGRYQGAAASAFGRRGPFLLRGAVAVNLGSRLLPAFPPALLAALARSGAPSSAAPPLRTVAATLLRGRHPLALGAAGAFLCLLGAAASAVL